ncbi:MAG: ribulokinase [Verrucomicrobiia bacterium]
MAFVLGIDYGTNSVRALVVDCGTGQEWGSCVVPYPSGDQGVWLDPRDHHVARQSPADYLYGLEASVRGAVEAARGRGGFDPGEVIGVGVDSTGSSPIPVDGENRPLASDGRWQKNLNAQCWLWKDHTSFEEAAAITRLAREMRPEYVAKCGNTYSSEWFWSKIWHCLKVDPEVFQAAFSWVELCDWIPSVLAGVRDPLAVRRGICAAGHKALYHESWGGLPDEEFLGRLDPELARLRGRLYERAYDARTEAGRLCGEWAAKLGLREGIPVAVGAFDVHYGAIGCGIREGVLVKAMGTSTCDCAVVAAGRGVPDIPGICGMVPGAILPEFIGIEAGQSAVGDIFKWFVERFLGGNESLYGELEEAARLAPGESGLLALDWNHGNRTILVDPMLTGLLVGQTLYTTRGEVYRALIEATGFGARTIIERLREYGVPMEEVICCGGLAEKNRLLMQIYADITGCTMRVAGSAQACALGSAVVAAVVAGREAGGYADFAEAQAAMTSVKPEVFQPDPARQAVYDQLYELYRDLHDGFGGPRPGVDVSGLMKRLMAIKAAVRG